MRISIFTPGCPKLRVLLIVEVFVNWIVWSCFLVIWQSTSNHYKDDYPYWKHIDLSAVIRSTLENFWGLILSCAYSRKMVNLWAVTSCRPTSAKSEISNLKLIVIGKQQILGLEVSMYNTLFTMQIFHRLYELFEVVARKSFWEPASLVFDFDERKQVALLDKL